MKLFSVSITKNYTKFTHNGNLNPLFELDMTYDCFMTTEMLIGFIEAKNAGKVFDKEGFPYYIGQIIIK